MYSSVILLFFLVVDSVDTALELFVCTQVAECVSDEPFVVPPKLATHPVKVKLVVEVDELIERHLEATDILSLFDVNRLTFKL